MRNILDIDIKPQLDDGSCGPSCLHAVYRYYGYQIPAEQVLQEVQQLEEGGTLAAYLGLHALRHGHAVTIYTSNLQMFDPSWFEPGAPPLQDRLRAQMKAKRTRKLRLASRAYMEFLDLGGTVSMDDITPGLIARVLEEPSPIIAGLSATWLYRSKRERLEDSEPDDVAGEPVGHFVVVRGMDTDTDKVLIADPYLNEPYPGSHFYEVNVHTFIAAVLLGIVTYDAKLIVVKPNSKAV